MRVLWRLRLGSALAVGLLVVHTLRYALQGAAAPGHDYLRTLAPAVLAVAGLALVELGLRTGRRALPAPPVRSHRLWAGASLALWIGHVGQEWLEARLAGSSPGSLAAVAGHAGLTGVVLAVTVAGAIALAWRGAAEAGALRVGPAAPALPVARAPVLRWDNPPAWTRSRPEARRAAGRGPPVAASA